MTYIKLEDDSSLVITVYEPIYRGDNLSKKITFLIPPTVGEIDMLSAIPYLCYIRSDGMADIVRLERENGMYKGNYCQYILPVSCRMSKYPGDVCAWLQIFSGTPATPTIAKSGECLIYIEESKNMDDCLCDQQISAIYAMQKEMDESVEVVSEQVETMQTELETKGDSLFYDAERKILQLKSGDSDVGVAIDMSQMVNEDEAIYFSEEDAGDISDDPDAVIRFD